MIPFCNPIIENHSETVLTRIRANQARYSYFEVWLDYIRDLNINFINNLHNAYPGKIVFLFRRQNLEAPEMAPDTRIEYLEALNGTNCHVDLDIKSQSQELSYLKTKGLKIKLITSYHNYKETPSDGLLNEIITQMNSYKPYIYKIATLCNSPSDGARLLNLMLRLGENGKRRIVLGMGEYGKITRIFGSLWGNEMLFAPESLIESSAPGQIARDVVEDILNKLSN